MVDIQTLVVRAKRGDVAAYEKLVNHFASIARQRAQRIARRNPSVDAADVESALVWAFQRCYEQYDADVGPFEHLVNSAWATETTGLLRKAVNTTRIYAMSLEELPSGNVDSDALYVDPSVDVEADLLADLAILEYRRKARQEDVLLEKVVLLLAHGGYTYVEIARECGITGSDEAAKMWTLRAIERLRRLFVPVGAKVRIKAPGTSLHGLVGSIVRFASDGVYTHIVRLDDGRIRAFRVNEIEVIEEGE